MVGRVSLWHIYETAKVKEQDPGSYPLESACKYIVGTARSMGIEL